MSRYDGPAELINPTTNVAVAVTAHLSATPASYTRSGEWGGELVATAGAPDPFMSLPASGVAISIGDRAGSITITSMTGGGGVAQVTGDGDPPF